MQLTEQQACARAEFREFVDVDVAPYADQHDREQWVPAALLSRLAAQGYLGAAIARDYGGRGMDPITLGLLHEEIGRGCSAVRSLLTVATMVGLAVQRWGDRHQKEHWLPLIAAGSRMVGFALSEPKAGSNGHELETAVVLSNGDLVVNGCKRWVTVGQIAEAFLVIARCDDKPVAVIVDRDTPGLSVTPIVDLLGARGSMLAEVSMVKCRVPRARLLGGIGFGLGAIAATALDIGRYSVAWGCVGLARACMEACVRYASERRQFGRLLRDHQLIQRMIADMTTSIHAARQLCFAAGERMDPAYAGAWAQNLMAKYFASTAASKAAADAVQIHGANGCTRAYPVERWFRDTKIMEIIEGSTQIQQIRIAQAEFQAYDLANSEADRRHASLT
jgi:alkylation response protein AidB-like acyl-CoA dehydrogenase